MYPTHCSHRSRNDNTGARRNHTLSVAHALKMQHPARQDTRRTANGLLTLEVIVQRCVGGDVRDWDQARYQVSWIQSARIYQTGVKTECCGQEENPRLFGKKIQNPNRWSKQDISKDDECFIHIQLQPWLCICLVSCLERSIDRMAFGPTV